MSYSVRLQAAESGETLELDEPFMEGGTYAIGGTTECNLNITYNYAEVFGSLVRDLNGKTAAETTPALREFCELWKGRRPYETDYWAPTPGNALKAVVRLLSFAERHPSGVWEVR